MKKVNIQELNSLVANNTTLMVKFSAEWCGQCKMASLLIDKVKGDFSEVEFVEVDVDDNNLWDDGTLNITEVPTFVGFKNKTTVFNQPGYQVEDKLVELLNKLK